MATRKALIERLGGRKFIVTNLALFLLVPLAWLKASGEAFLALGGIAGAFQGANAVSKKWKQVTGQTDETHQ